jgi:hypothetical protein
VIPEIGDPFATFQLPTSLHSGADVLRRLNPA